MLKSIQPWISAMRLRTLPLSVSGIFIGASLAYYNGFYNPWVFTFALCCAISLQILSNLANDYGDGVKGTDNEDRIGPKRALQSGAIAPEQMLHAIKMNILVVILFTFLLILNAFGSSNILYAFLFLGLGGISVYAAISYTIGSSPYGYMALGDVFVFIFFGIVSIAGSYFLFALRLDHVLVFPIISIGLLSVGVLNLNNMRDLESDKKSNKITLAVKLGKNRSKKYHYFLIGTAIVIAVLFSILYYSSPYNFLFYIAIVPLVLHLKRVVKIENAMDFNKELKMLSLSTFAFAVLFALGQVLY